MKSIKRKISIIFINNIKIKVVHENNSKLKTTITF